MGHRSAGMSAVRQQVVAKFGVRHLRQIESRSIGVIDEIATDHVVAQGVPEPARMVADPEEPLVMPVVPRVEAFVG